MITKNQTDQLVDYFKIDRFTIFREYLQLILDRGKVELLVEF